MNYNIGHFIVIIIQTIVFVTPVLLLFYKQGRKDQMIDEVVKDVNGMGHKIAEIRDNQSHVMAELKAQIEHFNNTLIRLSTLIEIMTKDVDELKKRNEKS